MRHALDGTDDTAVKECDDVANAGRMRESSASTAGSANEAADEEADGDAPNTLIGCPNSGATCGAAGIELLLELALPPALPPLWCAAANEVARRASALPVPED